MGQVVELEGAASAVRPGERIDVPGSGEPVSIAEARPRKALWVWNAGSEEVWIRFAEDGNIGEGTGIPLPAEVGWVIKGYNGAITACANSDLSLDIAEF